MKKGNTYIYDNINNNLQNIYRDLDKKRWNNYDFTPNDYITFQDIYFDIPGDLPKKYIKILKALGKLLDIKVLIFVGIHPIYGGYVISTRVLGYKYDMDRFIRFSKNLIISEKLFKEDYLKEHKRFKTRSKRNDDNLKFPHFGKAASFCIKLELDYVYKHIKKLLGKKQKLPILIKITHKNKEIVKYMKDRRIKNPILTRRNYEQFTKSFKQAI